MPVPLPAAPSLDFRNTNTLWCSVLVQTLVQCGVDTAVVSPGSRSTPLTMALVRHPAIAAIPVLDERSAAFFALGCAKRSGRPTVLVCTSGTAAANYLPAIVEAHESGTPLLVITADRPPEMRDCASGQTIDQVKLFGAKVNFFHDLAVPEARLDLLRYLRQTVAQACGRTLHPQPGPVHLNAPFRDPLTPVTDQSAAALQFAMDEFFAPLKAVADVRGSVSWTPPATTKGLIVAGPANPSDPAAYAEAVGRLARALGWPVLADALSPVRHHAAEGVAVIAHYDALLRDNWQGRVLRPEVVLCLEGWPTSKVLRTWMAGCGAEVTLVAGTAANRDGLHGRTQQIVADVESLVIAAQVRPETEYAQQWQAAESGVATRLAAALDAEGGLFEPKAAWLLSRHLPVGTPLFVASSMPVRDVEYFWPRNDRQPRFFFNRGANGIDGTLSTALGVAHGGEPAVLLTGDLSLLHDTNGFLLRPKLRGSLTVVLINNNGGGIFEHLPVAQFEPPFEEYFATPQEADFAKLCTAYGVEHIAVQDWAQFRALIASLPASGLRVLEIRTDRKRDAAQRKALLDGAA